MKTLLRVAALLLGLAALQAQANFHLWVMDELYTNADGTVQFLEFQALASGQEFLGGHTLSATGGSGTHNFTFPADLPGDTSGRHFLVGTQGFAALNIVQPDYVVPNGFFSQSGSVNFASVDVWNYSALPTDGTSALFRTNSTVGGNLATNFAGKIGSVTAAAPAPLNFEALWYNDPPDSEAGWGVNIAHQGDIFFVTWFTYDLDGSQMWLVASNVAKTTGNTYTGDLFRTTGSAFNAVPFKPLTVDNITKVGTITFNFTDATKGTMTYTVSTASGSVTQAKSIVREPFGTAPTCTSGGSPGAALNFNDLWYNAPAEREPGWGVNITHHGDIIFLSWFTYDLTGKGMWAVGPSMNRTPGTNVFTGDLYRTTGPAFNAQPFDPNKVKPLFFGTATLTFTGASSGTFDYTASSLTPSVHQTKNITRQNFSTPVTVCK